MSEPIEIYIDLNRESIRVGTLFRVPSRDRETISFEYHPSWLAHSSRFALEPALAIGEGRFYPEQGREMFGAIGDSAPDTWGRQLMRRSERRNRWSSTANELGSHGHRGRQQKGECASSRGVFN